MDSSALVFTCPSSLCQRPPCTLLFTAFMKLKLIYTLREYVSRVFYSKVSVKFSSVIHLTVDNYYLRDFGFISISV